MKGKKKQKEAYKLRSKLEDRVDRKDEKRRKDNGNKIVSDILVVSILVAPQQSPLP